MNDEDIAVEGTLTVTDEGNVPAPEWYEAYEGPVEIVTPALTIAIESQGMDAEEPGKAAGESAPFPMETNYWYQYGPVEGLGVDEETAAKIEATRPDKILFEVTDGLRLYRIDGLNSLAARNDCK